jgi:hypothetical protein
MSAKSKRDWMTEEEFSKRVGLCRMTLLRLRTAGKLPYCKIGRKIVYLERHVEEFFSNVEQNAGARVNAATKAALASGRASK